MLKNKELLQEICKNQFVREKLDKLIKLEYNDAVRDVVVYNGDNNTLHKKLGEVQYLLKFSKELEALKDE
jgi:hypothetical protein